MNSIEIILLIFIILETANVFTLYFNHSTKLANGMGAFSILEDKMEVNQKAMYEYLIYWVAGTKIIFISLIIIIIAMADEITQFYSLIALTLSISVFYWKLYPIMRKMDNDGKISPKGYSKILARLILLFIVVFITGVISHLKILDLN